MRRRVSVLRRRACGAAVEKDHGDDGEDGLGNAVCRGYVDMVTCWLCGVGDDSDHAGGIWLKRASVCR